MAITIGKGKALVNVEERTIKFPNGNVCPLSDEECYDADYGNMFWKLPSPQCDGPGSEKSLVYEVQWTLVTDYTTFPHTEFVQVNHDFQILLSDRTENICGYHSGLTEHPSLFVTLLPSNGPDFSKLVYSFRLIKVEVTKLFDLFSLDRCKVHNRISQHMLTLAVLSPVKFSFIYGGPGYTAVTRGEVVYLDRCNPVPVVPDLEVEACYNELPATTINQCL